VAVVFDKLDKGVVGDSDSDSDQDIDNIPIESRLGRVILGKNI
jgi:hypothetical protein